MTLRTKNTANEVQDARTQDARARGSRISWVDHARGIAIMLVVYRHVVIGLRRSGIVVSDAMYNVQEVFYNFRMPVFFVLSGIFVANSLRKRSRVDVLKDRASTVLYPYLVWAVILIALETLFSQFTNSKRDWHDFVDIIIQPRAIDHLWYLYALFNTSLLYLIFSWLIKNPWIHALLAIVLHAATFMPFLQGDSLVSDPFFFYPYFFIGALLSAQLLNRAKSDRFLAIKHLIWLLPLFLAGQWFWFIHRDKEEAGSYFALFFIISLVACYFVYIIARYVSSRGNDWLAWLGKYSLYIYILHVPVAAVIRIVLGHTGLHLNAWLLLLAGWTGGLLIPIGLYTGLKRFGFGKLFSLKGDKSDEAEAQNSGAAQKPLTS
jgi:fucose 4-O-acetylase-like acetyltransferase